jgi:cyclopropane-fatty-acyl-phospholipid synthase
MRLDENLERATELAGPERVRIWRLYLRAARMGFTSGFTSIYQVRAAPAGVVLAPVGAESTTVSA